ncbi:hypothetical protein MAR_028688 [Mya arenaria]|uniref:Uncharacterized protein n=1 Tax=Mya arenaria TaxID=6604 RepID=A0ABY7DIU4_MYAAR|nr:hypothetical protein MAR_028688 [Mya arenaria]
MKACRDVSFLNVRVLSREVISISSKESTGIGFRNLLMERYFGYRYCSDGCCPEEYCAYKLICYPKIHCTYACPTVVVSRRFVCQLKIAHWTVNADLHMRVLLTTISDINPASTIWKLGKHFVWIRIEIPYLNR